VHLTEVVLDLGYEHQSSLEVLDEEARGLQHDPGGTDIDDNDPPKASLTKPRPEAGAVHGRLRWWDWARGDKFLLLLVLVIVIVIVIVLDTTLGRPTTITITSRS
jgi:hypothetical protein